MRSWYIKLAGLMLWSAFLFVPFIARADTGFDTFLPIEIQTAKKKDNVFFSFGGFNLQLDENDPFKMPMQDQWSMKLNAGKDSVLDGELPKNIAHDRVPLDHGERDSYKISIGVNYDF